MTLNQLRHCFAVGFSLLSLAVYPSDNDCKNEASLLERRTLIARAALDEHAAFSGHRISANGQLWKFGLAETETEWLRNTRTSEPGARAPDRLAWRRVWEYWLNLEKHSPGLAWSRKVVSLPGLLNDRMVDSRIEEVRLSDLVAALDSSDLNGKESLKQATVRAAISDTPWSAAFISYVMDKAGLDKAQFQYAAAHWVYIKQAFGSDPDRAYRACDPLKTQPRVADLLCYSRGPKAPGDFGEWLASVHTPGFSAASHCEIVVSIDRAAAKMETVGGNVLQSIAVRRLKLNQDGVLSRSHVPRGGNPARPGDCEGKTRCNQEDLNLQQWSVLLQLR